MIKDTEKLTAEIMEQFYEFDSEKGMFKIFDSSGRLPAFFYECSDLVMCIESPENKAIPITYEITTFGKLKQYYDLISGMEFPY